MLFCICRTFDFLKIHFFNKFEFWRKNEFYRLMINFLFSNQIPLFLNFWEIFWFCNFICFLTLFQFFPFSLPKFFSKLKFYFWYSISDLIWLKANLGKKERFIYFHKLIGLYFVMKLDDLLLFIDRSSLHSSLLFIIIDHKFNIKNGQKYINISLTEKYE